MWIHSQEKIFPSFSKILLIVKTWLSCHCIKTKVLYSQQPFTKGRKYILYLNEQIRNLDKNKRLLEAQHNAIFSPKSKIEQERPKPKIGVRNPKSDTGV